MTMLAEQVRELLDYDPLTGVLTWRARPSYAGKRSAWNKKWAGKVAGSTHSEGYVIIRINKVMFYAHRLAWMHVYGTQPHGHIDHINGIKSDNRIANLRPATIAENNRNRLASSRSSTGVKGVSWRKDTKKWGAWISVNGKSIYLGAYNSASDASLAYADAAKVLHGEFARTA